MSLKSILLTLLVSLFLTGCNRTVPVRNFENNAFPSQLTLEQAETAILKGCIKLGWQCQKVSPGKIAGTLNIRDHMLQVDIIHTQSNFSVMYHDSANLKYNGTKIHRQYVNWSLNLVRTINAEAL
ncbi:hypothetical protein [Pseudoalteromonas rubra]|uniref:hypothetical protein n=1 Tax=Pseudoalteromonas rubra TaxID=43658 RepID=UPI000F77A826|nr:hypothetical protein [Pseudoalteromonas rubra]